MFSITCTSVFCRLSFGLSVSSFPVQVPILRPLSLITIPLTLFKVTFRTLRKPDLQNILKIFSSSFPSSSNIVSSYIPCLFIIPKILTTLTTPYFSRHPEAQHSFFLSRLPLPVSWLLFLHSLFGYNVCVACVDVVGRICCVLCDHGTEETVYAEVLIFV